MRQLLLLLALLVFSSSAYAQTQTVGLFSRSAGSEDGYVLFTPMNSDNTYLIDKCGYSVHTWVGSQKPGLSVYLLPDGSILRAGTTNNANFNVGGNGGAITRRDWNNNLMWSYAISSTTECQHHDICPLPNGNVLAIVWELKTPAEARAAGRDTAFLGTGIWSEKIVELQPSGTNGATVVWEWHVWDHLVQDFDPAQNNYDNVSDNPGLIDINYYGSVAPGFSDWLHINSVDYNPVLDQIMLSVHSFDEIWVIDHGTTTAEAADRAGGRYGQGGDLLYRWGNPAAYKRGSSANQMLFGQHNARWITGGRPDSGRIMIFNNGHMRPTGDISTVDVIEPPILPNGSYDLRTASAYDPKSLDWQYTGVPATSFFSRYISGAQPLRSGNVLICEGDDGRFFEVDHLGRKVWEYVNPITSSALVQGVNPAGKNYVFRCTQYAADYPGLVGKNLNPGKPLELNPLPYTCSMTGSQTPNGITAFSAGRTDVISAGNPFRQSIVLNAGSNLQGASVRLIDIAGVTCDTWSGVNLVGGTSVKLPVTQSLAPGIYFLELKTSDYRQVIKLIH